MDRYLVTGAFTLLIIEFFVLFSDTHWLNLNHESKNSKAIVGQVIKTRESVRRKHSDSIAWQDTEINENLLAYDSVLTLDQSTAQIRLQGNVQITLHENTLIVLEPMEEEDNPKLNFEEGMIVSRIKQKSLKLGAKNWNIEAQPGTDLSLKSLADDQLEIEVKNGEIQLSNLHTQEVKVIEKDTLIKTSATKIEEQSSISSVLKWKNTTQRIYSHIFPLNLHLEWQGEADSIEVVTQNQIIETLNVTGKSSLDYLLNMGTYTFRLKGINQSSSEKQIVEALAAPIVQYFSPLPRERFITGTEVYFNWTPLPNVQKYILEFTENNKENTSYLEKDSSKNMVHVKLSEDANLLWQVKAVDENNYIIPPLYSYPIYTSKDPFMAPKLKDIKIRKPSSLPDQQIKTEKPTLINQLWNLIIPTVYAEEEVYREVKFSWESIVGADFYIIEISSNPNFLNPEVNTRAYKNHFVWQEAYKHESYFIRVAAGDENGRIGLFSSPQLVNLKDIEVEEKPVQAKVLTEDELKKLNPIEYDANELNKIDNHLVQLEDIQLTNKIENQQIEPDFFMQWSLGGAYQFENNKIKNNFESEFNGEIPFSAYMLIQQKQWIAHLEIQYVQWKTDTAQYPFQKNLDYVSGNANFYFRFFRRNAVGLNYYRRPLLKRVSYEEIGMKDKDLLGLSYLYSYTKNQWASLTFIDFSFDSEFQQYALRNRTYRKFQHKQWQIILGLQLKGLLLNSKEYEGSIIEPGFFLGFEL